MVNGRLSLQELEEMIKRKETLVLPQTHNHRRKRSLLRIARTFADLEHKEIITTEHLEKAYTLSVKNFYFLKHRMMECQ